MRARALAGVLMEVLVGEAGVVEEVGRKRRAGRRTGGVLKNVCLERGESITKTLTVYMFLYLFKHSILLYVLGSHECQCGIGNQCGKGGLALCVCAVPSTARVCQAREPDALQLTKRGDRKGKTGSTCGEAEGETLSARSRKIAG